MCSNFFFPPVLKAPINSLFFNFSANDVGSEGFLKKEENKEMCYRSDTHNGVIDEYKKKNVDLFSFF